MKKFLSFFLITFLILLGFNVKSDTFYLSPGTGGVGTATFTDDPVKIYTKTQTNIVNEYYNTYSTNYIYSTNVFNVDVVITVYTTNTPPTSFSLVLEAESGIIIAPFVKSATYISQSIDTQGFTGSGAASWTFSIPVAGNYFITALVNAPNVSQNSFFIGMDSLPTSLATQIWDINPVTVGFQNRNVSQRGNGSPDSNQILTRIFNLSAGNHTLYINGREANVQLDKLTITLQ